MNSSSSSSSSSRGSSSGSDRARDSPFSSWNPCVYAVHGGDELTRICSLYELPHLHSAHPVWQAADHPSHVGLKIMAHWQEGILSFFAKAFSRLFGMQVRLARKDVVGARIKACTTPDVVSEFTITIYEPVVVLIVDEGCKTTLDTYNHPALVRHIHGQRVVYMENGFLNLKLSLKNFATYVFMFELAPGHGRDPL